MKLIYIILLSFCTLTITHAEEYPISALEERQKSMGSILSTPITLKNSSTTTSQDKTVTASKEKKLKEQPLNIHHNKDYKERKKVQNLWSASLEILSEFPIMYINDNEYIIITDWINEGKFEKSKINLNIKLLENSQVNLNLKIFTQRLRDSVIKIDKTKSQNLENKIILRAIELSTNN